MESNGEVKTSENTNSRGWDDEKEDKANGVLWLLLIAQLLQWKEDIEFEIGNKALETTDFKMGKEGCPRRECQSEIGHFKVDEKTEKFEETWLGHSYPPPLDGLITICAL